MKSFLGIFRRTSSEHKFEELLRPYLNSLYKQAFHYTGNSFDAEDLLQDVLLETYQKRERLQYVKNLPAWLNRCLYFRFVDRHRVHKRQPEIEELTNEDLDEKLQGACLSEDEYFKGQMYRGMDKLSVEQRAVINLHDLIGYSLPEISGMMDTPVGTLKSSLHRGRKKLKEHLKLQPEMLESNLAYRGK